MQADVLSVTNKRTAGAIAWYDDPASWAAFNLGVSAYAQDAPNLEQVLAWPGVGYGGLGAGSAIFEPWFKNISATEDEPLQAGAAWLLTGKLVSETPNRLSVQGVSSNGFAALAGRSNDTSVINIFVNNYQVNYDVNRGT